MKKLFPVVAVTFAFVLASCNQQPLNAVPDKGTLFNPSAVLEGLIIEPNTIVEVTEQQFLAIQELRKQANL